MEWNLVLHQLRCNGVLEGIRICRKGLGYFRFLLTSDQPDTSGLLPVNFRSFNPVKGYPSRVQYDEFVGRYVVLYPQVKKNEDYEDYKKTAQEICKGIALEDWKHKFGLTKMFFKAGIIGDLEDARDDKIASILTQLQTFFRYQLAQKNYKEAIARADAIEKVQFNLRAFMTLKDWEWMKMIFRIKASFILDGEKIVLS